VIRVPDALFKMFDVHEASIHAYNVRHATVTPFHENRTAGAE
jgi:hypothetical protein